MSDPIVISGGGLTGCVAALTFAKRFPEYKVIILEHRDDYRKELKQQHDEVFGQLTSAATRSINLALSHRGICGLKKVGLFDEIQKQNLLIPMYGRMIHDVNGKLNEQPYGQEHDAIYSVSRLALNCLLLSELEKLDNVEIRFLHKLKNINNDIEILVEDSSNNDIIKYKIKPLFLIGCDGAFSATRSALSRLGRYNMNIQYIEHGYKELTIHPDKHNNFLMACNYLHIWPRDDFMLIGLPNPDKTFTCTLFAPWNGKYGLDKLNNNNIVNEYFTNNFNDFTKLCPNYLEQFLNHPSSPLLHIHINPWNYNDKILLMGDAAHAVVPFYGQGMNCCLEDVVILDELLDKYNNNILSAFNDFSKYRYKSTEGLSILSLNNYVEMRSLTAKTWFIYKKKLENFLNWCFPSLWKPLYSMVAFTRTPYNQAIKRAERQDKILTVACLTTAIISGVGFYYITKNYFDQNYIKSQYSNWKGFITNNNNNNNNNNHHHHHDYGKNQKK